jgi:PAS domain S-box-containing protein
MWCGAMQDEKFPTLARAENVVDDGGLIGAESKTGIIFQLADTTIAACDRRVEQLLGYSTNQLLGTTAFEPPWQTIYPDGSPVAPENYPAIVALKSGKPCHNAVIGFYRPSGELVWLQLNSTPLFQADPTTPYAVVTTLNEISNPPQPAIYEQTTNKFDIVRDRQRAESALRQSEERYRTLFDSIDEGFCVIEVLFDENNTPNDYRFLEVNPVFEQQTGLKQAEGKTALELVPDLETFWFEIYGKIALTGESLRFENGSEVMNRWFDVYAFRIGQKGERKVAVLFKDISDRKRSEKEREQAEKALLASEEQSRNILESITEAFFALDRNWQFTYVNPQSEKLLDRPRGELIGKNFWREFPGLVGSELGEMHHRVMRNHVAESLTAFYPDHDRWYEVRSYPSVKGITIYFRNVTEEVRIEQEREQLLQREQVARETAETANQIKDEFLAVLSHELRSPLNPILGWSALLQQKKLDAERTTYAIATIERNARLQVQLIDDLLDISRILRGKMSLTVTPVDLNSVISAALETVRLAAEAKSIVIETIAIPSVEIAMGDAGRLQQVVWNLVANAVKFTPPGGKVTVKLSPEGNYAQIQVTDSGKGITSDFLPYVFEHFRQEDGATTRKFGGLGLGLSIARQIIEMHGGTVSVDSPGTGQGATFTVKIPLAAQSSEPSMLTPSPDPRNDLSGKRILVVDDETDSREFLAFILEQAKASVTTVASGIEALQAISQSIPDLIVSDIGMPQMDGYMLLRQIRTLPQGGQIPAIALTAYAGEIDRHNAIAVGFERHIPKPIDPEAVVRVIAELIAKQPKNYSK